MAVCPLAAQQTVNELWPEVDVYATLNSRLRASWFTTKATDKDSNTSTWEFGPNLDIYLKSFRNRSSQTLDVAGRKYLWMRLGYHILPSSNGNTEQRGIFEITSRYYLPKSFLLSDRNRLDFRVQNSFTWRYRNRVTLERDFKVGRIVFDPYARAEAFYEITTGNWNRFAFAGGVVFPFAKHFEIEPYIERQINSGSNPKFVNGFGLTLSIYF
jgi:hypothetical protein